MLLAIIPARGGSERIKNKNIVPFCGRPLITYSLNAARDSGIFDEIHVSTDSQDIAAAARESGSEPHFLRNTALADNKTPLLPVLSWVLSEFAIQGRFFTEVCQIMATAPLITGDDLKAAYAKFIALGNKDPLIAMSPFPAPVEWAMDIDPVGYTTARTPENLIRRSQDLKPAYYDSGAFAFYTAEQIRNPGESGRYLAWKLPKSRSVDIDNYDDLEMAEILYCGSRGRVPSRSVNPEARLP